MASCASRRHGFRPRADAAVLSTKTGTLPDYPDKIAPIFDPENYDKPVKHSSALEHDCLYPPSDDHFNPAIIPERPSHLDDRYLRAFLASDERLRLSMLWYYAHDIFTEKEFLLDLQEKAAVAQESTGWEYVVIGLLDVNVFTRLATIGLPLGILPRGETLCAHTVTQPPGVSYRILSSISSSLPCPSEATPIEGDLSNLPNSSPCRACSTYPT